MICIAESDVIACRRAFLKKAVPDKRWLDVDDVIKGVVPLALGEVRRHTMSLQPNLRGARRVVVGRHNSWPRSHRSLHPATGSEGAA